MLTPDEAAKILKVEPETVRAWARDGIIPAHRYGRLWRFDENEITTVGKVECPSTATPSRLIGGSASRSAVAKFVNRQARRTEKPPKNSNTSSVTNIGERRALANRSICGKTQGSGG